MKAVVAVLFAALAVAAALPAPFPQQANQGKQAKSDLQGAEAVYVASPYVSSYSAIPAVSSYAAVPAVAYSPYSAYHAAVPAVHTAYAAPAYTYY